MSTQNIHVGTHYTHNICFYGELEKIITKYPYYLFNFISASAIPQSVEDYGFNSQP